MLQTYTAVVKQDDGAWIGWVEEVPGVHSWWTHIATHKRSAIPHGNNNHLARKICRDLGVCEPTQF